jgi:hypothetical protein
MPATSSLVHGLINHRRRITVHPSQLGEAEAVAYITSHICSALKTVHVGFSMGIAGTKVARFFPHLFFLSGCSDLII